MVEVLPTNQRDIERYLEIFEPALIAALSGQKEFELAGTDELGRQAVTAAYLEAPNDITPVIIEPNQDPGPIHIAGFRLSHF